MSWSIVPLKYYLKRFVVLIKSSRYPEISVLALGQDKKVLFPAS